MEKIALADMPRVARAAGEPITPFERTLKKPGDRDISGDATAELLRRHREKVAAASKPRRRWFLFGKRK